MSQTDLFPVALPPRPTRAAALERVAGFARSMGRAYASRRNFDFGPADRSNVSAVSPHVRHRLVLEEELAAAALKAHQLKGAEKFIQEICWRTYWKGWLEQRPAVWTDYCVRVRRDLDALEKDSNLSARYEHAVAGRTGLACFDSWARELVETGYLHNHARMWFASIWIYTLDLPWPLGADFFLRHLMDGDAASNTLSWRWVCGLQTVGKTYLARASNINTYTAGRFQMQERDLAGEAPPLDPDLVHPAPTPVAPGDRPDPDAPAVLLLHDEDLHAESWDVDELDVRAIVTLNACRHRSPLEAGSAARAFTQAALHDGAQRAEAHFAAASQAVRDVEAALGVAQELGAGQIVAQRPRQGPVRALWDAAAPAAAARGVRLCGLRRAWDRAFFPRASKGFFKLKQAIPSVLDELGLA